MSSIRSDYDPQNVFAKILRGELPCKKIFENEYILAFHDIMPQTPIHALVISKKPYVSFADFTTKATSQEIIAFTKAIAETANLLGLEQNGYRIVSNIGKNSGQEVPHFHVHILGGRPLGILG